MATKTCPMCNVEKDVTEFGHRSGLNFHLLRSHCKACNVKSVREYQKRNPQKHKDNSKHSDLTTKYGISLDDYNKLYLSQEGKCLVCKAFQESLVVDHSHETNEIRGLLCINCNIMLGHAKDDTNILTNAILYLIKADECRSKKSS